MIFAICEGCYYYLRISNKVNTFMKLVYFNNNNKCIKLVDNIRRRFIIEKLFIGS